MILQRLAEHYDRIVASGQGEGGLAPPGFSMQKISFCIVLEPDGRVNQLQSMQRQEGKSLVATPLVVPGSAKPSGSGLNPCFLWDNAAYMLGWTADPDKTVRAALAFEAFRQMHLALEAEIQHPAFQAVCRFLKMWSPELATEHAEALAVIATNFGVFRLAGETAFVHELVARPSSQSGEVAGTTSRSICLVTGMEEEIARLHDPKIKGVVGAQSSGALLVSFNASSFESYGRSQSYNAPVSEAAAFRYANALNHLLNSRDRRVMLGDTTITFWADHPSGLLEDSLGLLFGEPLADPGALTEEDRVRVDQARHLLLQLRAGTRDGQAVKQERETKFFMLGLSPNASRLSVRLWVEADASALERRLGQHLQDLALTDSREDRLLTLRQIVAATGRAKEGLGGRMEFDTKAVSPQLAGDLARAVLTGAPYPQSLLATMLRRIHSDGAIASARVAAIKGCLVRNSRLRGKPLEVSKMLDSNNENPAYCCGRAFAVLEKVQTDSADGELNSTISDRFFTSASTTPLLVFPRLLKLNRHHISKPKLAPYRGFWEWQLNQIVGKINEFPRLLNLEQQGQFVLGYFHQRQDLYTSKKDKAEQAEGAAA